MVRRDELEDFVVVPFDFFPELDLLLVLLPELDLRDGELLLLDFFLAEVLLLELLSRLDFDRAFLSLLCLVPRYAFRSSVFFASLLPRADSLSLLVLLSPP